VLAVFLFMKRMSEVTNDSVLTRELRDDEEEDLDPVDPAEVPPGVEIYEVSGPFFFGAAESFRNTVGQVARPARVLIIRMRGVPAIDSTGLHALRDVVRRSRTAGAQVLLSGVHAQPLVAIERSGFLDELGQDALVGNVRDGLERARRLLETPARPSRPRA
jgi:SulP family sulfate permease